MNDMKQQPEALRLARELEGVYPVNIQDQEAAASELRRLWAANIDCVAWYEAAKAQRDALLEALMACDEAMSYMSEYDIPVTLPPMVKAAIAKAAE